MTDSTPTPRERVIDLSVEVAGTPDEVWQAIATGPGITSWYVPTTVEERVGGATTSRFGEGPEMLIPGVVTAWEPPHRIVFAGHETGPGMAFEWLVEARDQGTCVVRLVNSGFVEGSPWDDQYDGMVEGWQLFLTNLQLHQAHFAGRNATPMLQTAAWPLSQTDAWSRLTRALGLPATLTEGDRVEVATADAPALAGTVASFWPGRLTVILDAPAPGTAFLAAEGMGEGCGVSVWQYLYGADTAEIVARDEPRWTAWLQAHAAEARTE
jgi:uncharacterized protein YndB with AHSA1/START domain